ncbi:bifunctional proline dehydrogenase/L-glutamate gamma-semialdehyde dehydrogenase PutA [Thalassobaculum salexigens]|uniref:bifunctional proline dehydrogenase/L-glutamate gamma-semialdehyde dehydrogenase PutA n=1 Tax=Thalassobaculum salexigens TaxID=455360 RepID=UPI00248EB024|nr:bifunctional proline dehydrogenase/L-glutamate gamma-semialdehyde dehydrogenase PutA [Thalassobaculum salexigens]
MTAPSAEHSHSSAPNATATHANADLRAEIRAATLAEESARIAALKQAAGLSEADRTAISKDAARLVESVRSSTEPTAMESFLAEYGLSTKEGIALMCLAEALLRVPDTPTIDALIEDKIVPGEWGQHLGHSSSSLVNASTWALMLTGTVLRPGEQQGLVTALRGAVRRLGEPVVRTATGQAMIELGRQFVLGRTIEEAMKRGAGMEERGYTYSFDMLGEAARTEADARRYHLSYSDAITAIAPACKSKDIRENPGISVKLSALHPRYEVPQKQRVMSQLTARCRSLALLAKSANMGFNIDAEEADRLDLSLDVIEAVLSDEALEGWDGFGVVVQAFGPRAHFMLRWLYELAERLDRRIMVRLVKGAYWDTEIKRAQTLGLDGYPVFTQKANTDVSYIACARLLLGMTDRIYPQFASHNAHTAAAILHMAGEDRDSFEFQRLHGMGESLHGTVKTEYGTRCRIYAPVGKHQDLLAYLVRRLLENGANSSFVNQIVDASVPAERVAADPFPQAGSANPHIPAPANIYGGERRNAKGWDQTDPVDLVALDEARAPFAKTTWQAAPTHGGGRPGAEVINPADPDDLVGRVVDANEQEVEDAILRARAAQETWRNRPAAERASLIEAVADLYEANAPELFVILAREAGKTLLDAIGEVREAVDFCRYYAAETRRFGDAEKGRGTFVCISPWNFPLAIFTGQITAALVSGNTVIAKPAEQTALLAARAVALMHEAGLPDDVIQLLPGDGAKVGGALVGDPRIDGVCFTGSTDTARRIQQAMAETGAADAPLIAETGGLNAMIVDSTALPEQAVRDIIASAFQSAGQRCSALRCLYVQQEVKDRLLEMLFGAMDELRLGDPRLLSTDVGPVIDEEARAGIEAHCMAMEQAGKVLKRLKTPAKGTFVPPTVIEVSGIEELEREIFGPVLHVATFAPDDIDGVVERVNAKGYGLTFGLHTRVDSRVQQVVDRAEVGNLYVNRNQIGAIVGSQPFGGEGLSGTGPKAGGPHYLSRFRTAGETPEPGQAPAGFVDAAALSRLVSSARGRSTLRAVGRALSSGSPALSAAADIADQVLELPGPTGESNRFSVHPRGVILCLGPSAEVARDQAIQALATGNRAVVVAPGAEAALAELKDLAPALIVAEGTVEIGALSEIAGIDGVAYAGTREDVRPIAQALAKRAGPLLIPITDRIDPERYVLERHLCIDTTAAGGNASLLAASGPA